MQLLENIFSVKNDNLHKVITILFFKLKFRNQRLFEEKRIANIENQLVSVNENIEKLNNTIENILKKTQSSQINILNIAKAIRNETYTVRNKILKISSESEISQLQNREIIYANVLRDCTSNADWLKEKDWTLP